MTLRKAVFSTFLFSTSIYILLPTPDELLIYPSLALFFSFAFHLPFVYDLLLAMVMYRSLGSFCLLGALVIGGKPIYNKLKEKFMRR
jgi:hypothetical protein